MPADRRQPATLSMSVERRPPAIAVTRTVVVRIDRELDSIGIGQMRRILHDLIEDQGVQDLIIDLSIGISVNAEVGDILAEAKTNIARVGGVLELRVPADLPVELVELADEIPTFRPLAANPHIGSQVSGASTSSIAERPG